MDTANEILDAIEILSDKKISENITKVLTGICTSVNINKNTCVMDSNGVSSTVQFYGSPPEVNGLYRIFVPSNDMSRAFVIAPPKFTVNPNLLDNSLFQVWQKYSDGSYTGVPNNIYIADRWRILSSDGSKSNTITKVSPYGIKNASGPNCRITQRLENAAQYNGMQLTLSMLKNNGLHKATKIADGWNNTTDIFAEFSSVLAWLNAGETIYAVKLELGDTQTLAHQDTAGKWMLNEVPDYGEQLRRCQRYAFSVVNSDDNWEILGVGFAMDTNQLFCFIPTPTTLRGKPSIRYSGSFRAVRNTDAGNGIVINTMVVDHASNNGVSIICRGTTNFEVGEFYMLWEVPTGSTNSLIFSADL